MAFRIVGDIRQVCRLRADYEGRFLKKRGFLIRTARRNGLAFANSVAAAELDARPAARRAIDERARQAQSRIQANEDYKSVE
ncbi:hypothetical protein GPL21_33935 [Bradyrhizobium pachyrhizi]|uniref:Uncharacterized protein n=1 Tax=Bradyrhizobium pachyrhizi TaxID=280333 RepID=A0A844SVR0_9BRAD|nr:hypothetical protein [Bradyrhizobium pachyrhizi]MVT70086.1 hypothetical protein [Bradyrhizobium pachyrhizi]